jgi:pimeloyl-ACP methyl ester carboxylesterase
MVIVGRWWWCLATLQVIDDAGHLVIEEQPDRLLATIRPFLARSAAT